MLEGRSEKPEQQWSSGHVIQWSSETKDTESALLADCVGSGGVEKKAGDETKVIVGREYGEVVLKRKSGHNQVAHRERASLASELCREFACPPPGLLPHFDVVESLKRIGELVPLPGPPHAGQQFRQDDTAGYGSAGTNQFLDGGRAAAASEEIDPDRGVDEDATREIRHGTTGGHGFYHQDTKTPTCLALVGFGYRKAHWRIPELGPLMDTDQHGRGSDSPESRVQKGADQLPSNLVSPAGGAGTVSDMSLLKFRALEVRAHVLDIKTALHRQQRLPAVAADEVAQGQPHRLVPLLRFEDGGNVAQELFRDVECRSHSCLSKKIDPDAPKSSIRFWCARMRAGQECSAPDAGLEAKRYPRTDIGLTTEAEESTELGEVVTPDRYPPNLCVLCGSISDSGR